MRSACTQMSASGWRRRCVCRWRKQSSARLRRSRWQSGRRKTSNRCPPRRSLQFRPLHAHGGAARPPWQELGTVVSCSFCLATLQEFAASELLCRLAERRSLASLLAPPLRQPLLDYLVLEAKCRRWYSMSRHYFAAAAQQLVAQLDDESDEGGSVGREPAAVGQQEEPPSKRRRAWQGGSARGKGPISGEQAAVLAVALECAREEVQAAVFAMPAGGDCIEVPQLFAGAVPAEAEEEVVVLDSEEEDERMGGLQQQQQAQQAQQEEAPQQQGSQRERQQEQAG
jgi:hypothetical protein